MSKTFLSANWEHLIMANYAVDPALLLPYLPKGVELDHYNNQYFVSLVGFMFNNTRLFSVPIPFFGSFEEINLRFYVKRIEGENIKRGVVFINETVPSAIVAYIANKLYKEHYTAIPTINNITSTDTIKKIQYEWKINGNWNNLLVNSANSPEEMIPNSIEEFIFEHYYGYTKVNDRSTLEYRVNHPRWLVNKVKNYHIDCDFRAMYGKEFAYLQNSSPHSVILAEGSAVTVDWKRTQIHI